MAYQFQGQLRDEEVILFAKQHPFVLLRTMFACTAYFLLPFAVYNIFGLTHALAWLIPLCFVATAIRGYTGWAEWNRSMILLTNRRILMLVYKGITHRQMFGSGLEHVHRVTHEINGIGPSLFNYGSLAISTDDPSTALVMSAVANPFDIQQEILRAVFGEADTA